MDAKLQKAKSKKTAARLECMGRGGGVIDENATPDRLQATKRRHANAATGSWGDSAP